MEVVIFHYSMMDGHQRINKMHLLKRRNWNHFEFVYSMVTHSRSLLYLKQAVINLQGKIKDIVSGVSTVMQCCEDLKK